MEAFQAQEMSIFSLNQVLTKNNESHILAWSCQRHDLAEIAPTKKSKHLHCMQKTLDEKWSQNLHVDPTNLEFEDDMILFHAKSIFSLTTVYEANSIRGLCSDTFFFQQEDHDRVWNWLAARDSYLMTTLALKREPEQISY
jgi:hypothetical protein